MAYLVIPVDSANKSYLLTTDLEDSSYTFHVYWCARLGSWFFDLEDENGNPLMAGQRIATNTALNSGFQDKLPGLLTSISTDNNDDSDPGEKELGVRVQLIYVTSDDEALA